MLCVDLDVDLYVDLVDELHGGVDDAGERRAVRVQVPGLGVVHLGSPVSGAPVRGVDVLQVLPLLILELRGNI